MIYLDNAATTLHKPERVIRACKYALENLSANAGRGSHPLAVKAANIVYRARKAVCSLVGCDEVIFTLNCTDALNTVLFGTAKPRGHVVTTVYEHNSVLRPLRELNKRMGVEFTAVAPDRNGIIDPADIERAIRPNTYMVVVNHVSNVTGAVAPVTRIGGVARRHGLLFLVDGAQSVGYLDVDMPAIHCNYLCFSPHKGLHGTQGIGCLCVNGTPPLNPYRFGGTGTSSHTLDQPQDIPEGFECGTLPVHNIHALIAAVTEHKNLSNRTFRRLAACGEYMRAELMKIPRVTVYGKHGVLPNLVSFNIEGMNSSATCDILAEQYDIATRCGPHCAPLCHQYLGTLSTGAVRASLSYDTPESDVEFFVKSVREIAK